MTELTNDADKMLCCIYKQYLERRDEGLPKVKAWRFDAYTFYKEDKNLKKWNESDIKFTLLELAKGEYVKMYLGGEFDVTETAIIYLEKRFQKGLSQVLDIISKFI